MNLIKGMLINLMLLSVAASAWGLSGARLISQSQSGQTALFNLGIHDGVKEGDYAVIVKEIRDVGMRDLRMVPVAKAKNIKISPVNSVWILYRIYDSELLVSGQKYLLLSESHMLSGRRDPRFGRISVVSEKNKAALETQHVLSEDKDRISKLKPLYPEISSLHGKESRTDNDVDIVDVDSWEKNKKDKYRTALYRSPHQVDFRRELRLSTFEKLVTGYLKKVNDPKFNYDQFYDEQMKSDFANEFRKRSNFSTEYENFLSAQAQKAVADAKLYRVILEKGGSWSEDFSDEELRVILNQVSVLQEKDRRLFVQSKPLRYATYLGLGWNLTEEQTEKDAAYRREGAYSVDLDMEATPFLNHEVLERFTLSGAFRMNRTAFSNNNKNASLNELSLAAGLNWYPLYAPHTIEAAVLFLGAYVRSGVATVDAPSLNEEGKYTLISLPGVRGGMRYNFRNNVGLRIALSMETLTLDRYEQSQLNSSLPDKTSVFEGKMNFAVAYSF